MPNNIIKSFANKTNKTTKEVDRLWNKAESIIQDQYKDVKKDSESYFKLVVGVLKKMIGIDENIASGDIAIFANKISLQRRNKKNSLSQKIIDNLRD